MANKVVEVILTAKDLTGTAVSRFRRRWRALDRTIKNVGRTMVAFTATVTGAVFGLQKLSDQGEKVLAVKDAFARITDDETAALQRLRQASAGSINDYKLMALANQALTLGAAESVEQFAEMVEISRALGRAQGVDALSALESFTIGMARQSPRILDNIGLQIKLGDTTTFTARVMAQARQKADELTGSMGATAGAGERFAATMANIRDRLAEWVATSPQVAEVLDGIADAITGVVDAITQHDWAGLGDVLFEIGKVLGARLAQGINLALAESVRDGNVFTRMFGFAEKTRGFLRDNAARAGDMASASGARLAELLAGLASNRPVTQTQAQSATGGGGFIPFLGLSSEAATLAGGQGFDFLGGPTPQRAAFLRRQAANEGNITPPDVEGLADVPADLEDVGEAMAEAGEVAIASMAGAAEAILAGSEHIEASMVRMITNIVRTLPGVGGTAGALIGGLGGIFGALLSKNNGPVPVRMTDIEDRAAAKINRTNDGPTSIHTTINGATDLDALERDLRDRENRDATRRFGRDYVGRP